MAKSCNLDFVCLWKSTQQKNQVWIISKTNYIVPSDQGRQFLIRLVNFIFVTNNDKMGKNAEQEWYNIMNTKKDDDGNILDDFSPS